MDSIFSFFLFVLFAAYSFSLCSFILSGQFGEDDAWWIPFVFPPVMLFFWLHENRFLICAISVTAIAFIVVFRVLS